MATVNVRPNILAPAEHSGGLLRTPEVVRFAWGVFVQVPHPTDLPPQLLPMYALMAAHDAHARRIEELAMLVELLIDAGGTELAAKLISFEPTGSDSVKQQLQSEALGKLREICAKRVQGEVELKALEQKQADEDGVSKD